MAITPSRRGDASRMPRRKAAGAAAALIAAMVAVPLTVTVAASPAAADGGQGFDIPDSALVRALGDIAEGSCVSVILPACDEGSAAFMPYNTPGLGIPLGGIGAGSFMINQSGSFGPWFFGGARSTSYEVRSTPQAALHVREEIGGHAATKTLVTAGPQDETLPSVRDWADPPAGWNALETGEAEYAALYPFGWMDYELEGFSTDVSMRFYSPIVAGEEKRSSLPVAYFDVSIANPTDESADVSAMFTMPNVAGHEGRAPETVREGLDSSFRAENGISAVTLSSDSDENTPDAYASEWTIAAAPMDGAEVSYVTSWDAEGDGSDVYAPFADDGALPDGALDDSASAGAISVSATLAPGESRTIPFALSWDFPQVAFADDNTVWMRRYTEFYGARTTETNDYAPGSYPFHQSFEIARDALSEREQNLADVLSWWQPIVDSDVIPADVSAAAMNHLANVTFHTGLWENGLVRNTVPVTKGGDRIGTAVPDTHGYFGSDSNAGGVSTQGQGGEIGIYSYDVYSQLFPFIERDRMRAKVEQILVSDDGDPGDFDVIGSTDPDDYALGGNPFITWNPHNQSSNDSRPGAGLEPAPGTMSFLDRAANNIIRMYDYAERRDDSEFLEFAYPAMNRVLELLQKTVPGDVALPEPTNGSNPQGEHVQQMANLYNAMPTDRFDSYTSGLYLLALEAMISSGTQLGENPETIARWEADLAKSKTAYEDVFWNDAEGYYRYTLEQEGADVVHIGTLFPQYLAERLGLPDVVDADRYKRHLESMFPLVVGTNGPKLAGLPEGETEYPLVGPQGAVYEPNVVVGAAYSAAANYVSAGMRFDDPELTEMGLQLARPTIDQIWNSTENGFEFNTPYLYSSEDPSKWIYPSFENNLSIWQIVHAFQAGVISEPEPPAEPAPSTEPIAQPPSPAAPTVEPSTKPSSEPTPSAWPSEAPIPAPQMSESPAAGLGEGGLTPTGGEMSVPIGLVAAVLLGLGAWVALTVRRRTAGS